MTRTLDTLISQALMMQEIDQAVGSNVMIKGWYADLSPEEREAFEGWLTEQFQRFTAFLEENQAAFQQIGEAMAQFGEAIVKAFAEGVQKA